MPKKLNPASAKMQLLNVKQETLEQFGAVSEQTANEMLNGIISLSKSFILKNKFYSNEKFI